MLRKIKKLDLFFGGVLSVGGRGGSGSKNLVDPGRENCKYGPSIIYCS